jgi:restriction system protein
VAPPAIIVPQFRDICRYPRGACGAVSRWRLPQRTMRTVRSRSRTLAWPFSASKPAVGMVLLFALVDRALRGHRLQQQQLSDLAALSWQQFEEVIADAFRRHGYWVAEVGSRGTADGGVDLILERDGKRIVVRGKHWQRDVVGVAMVRELYGVQRAMPAGGAMYVVQGRFSPDATAFAARVGMTLVGGSELLRIIGAGLRGGELELPVPDGPAAPPCPACGGDMVRRTAWRGDHAGEDFWGCSTFPACRATVSMAPEAAARR